MPITRLSKGNIERARRSFRRLSARRKRSIRRPKAYVFKTAWNIQRRRVRKLGHR